MTAGFPDDELRHDFLVNHGTARSSGGCRELLERLAAQIGDIDAHRCQPRPNKMGERNVVEAGQGDILRNPQAELAECLQSSRSHHVVGREYGVRQGLDRSQLQSGRKAGGGGEVSGNDVARIERRGPGIEIAP